MIASRNSPQKSVGLENLIFFFFSTLGIDGFLSAGASKEIVSLYLGSC